MNREPPTYPQMRADYMSQLRARMISGRLASDRIEAFKGLDEKANLMLRDFNEYAFERQREEFEEFDRSEEGEDDSGGN